LTYTGATQVTAEVIAAVTSPAAAGGWVQLSGTYSVPTGIDGVRVQLEVASTVSQGSVYWDDLSLTKTGAIDGLLIGGLTGGTTIVDDVQDNTDSITVGHRGYGRTTRGFAVRDAKEAASHTTDKVVATATGVSSLRQSLKVAANSAYIDFSGRIVSVYNSTIGSDFTQYFAGGGQAGIGMNTNLQAANYKPDEVYYRNGSSSASSGSVTNIYNAKVTASDTMTVSITAGSYQQDENYNPTGTGWFGSPSTIGAPANYVLGRVYLATGLYYIYAKFKQETVELGYVSNGAKTVWQTYTYTFDGISYPVWNPGTTYSLVCGTAAGTRNYEVWVGNQKVIAYTEVGTSSSLGSTLRYAGFQMDGYVTPDVARNYRPGSVTDFAFW
jgi:hypothetical protein